jgi:hypothetical protein
MDEVWTFLGMTAPEHNFDNVEQVTYEDDSVHGLDLHNIRSKIEPVEDDSTKILGTQVCQDLAGAEFWRPQTPSNQQ